MRCPYRESPITSAGTFRTRRLVIEKSFGSLPWLSELFGYRKEVGVSLGELQSLLRFKLGFKRNI